MKNQLIITILLYCSTQAFAKADNDKLESTSFVSMQVIEKMESRGVHTTEGNRVTFFTSGHDKFESLFNDIRAAKSFIHLEYFNFRNDSIANKLFDLLEQKVAEGVEVRALYDAFGNSSNNRPIKRKMHNEIRKRGIDLVLFSPLRFPWLNRIIPRDHRKIVVIDGKIAYTGGMNVADYYIIGKPEIGDWHDLHMRLEGPCVDDLQRIFVNLWKKTTGENLESVQYFPTLYNNFTFYNNDPDFIFNNKSTTKITIVDRATGKTSDAMRELFVTMINSAKESIKIIHPYFVPTHKVRKALKNAIDRGINVQIILSAKSDIPLTPEAAHYVGNNLMKRGAQLWLYHGGFHHTKLLIVDDKCSTVGSTNMDARSLRCDFETNGVIHSSELTRQLVEHFEDQKRHSTEIHKGYWKTRSTSKQFSGWFGNLLTPVL